MNNKFEILMIVNIIMILFLSCFGSTVNKEHKAIKPLMDMNTTIDSCRIDIRSNSLLKEYNCKQLSFTDMQKTVLVNTNADYTTIVYPVLYNSSISVFEFYDSPTGRRKLLLFDLIKKKAHLSSWFDDSAVGDSVATSTISVQGFEVYKSDQGGAHYSVKFKQIKCW